MTECIEIISRYQTKCRIFRQRFLDLTNANCVTKVRIAREFVTILGEMEHEARVAAQSLVGQLPPHESLVQSELVTYLAGRTAREA